MHEEIWYESICKIGGAFCTMPLVQAIFTVYPSSTMNKYTLYFSSDGVLQNLYTSIVHWDVAGLMLWSVAVLTMPLVQQEVLNLASGILSN